ncbi:AMSH/STAMBP protein-like protein, ubiquitin specific-protease [Schizosaccharomyces osmophilus]|uniref:AMSH/STAMBP protein-like protein, ubiquitin specific-protease n=1 Tax=Schizosaccharomyces osmophilus TaxID=2545709 RepID=A0AAF0AXA7_9SCHI|nr:AMSH/STAMBP protein-like protein, ubiquitin specific-protease [Schizosaccharomyces osmophilus]WBW74073.1 AMSH/STAMBP protein-like protein, ubiquitin specific-protease [Schizosaccharomyces osmophilus]
MSVVQQSETPLSYSDLATRASNFSFNANLPLKNWLRTSQAILKQAHVYVLEKDYSNGAFLLIRYSELFLKCQQHPESQGYRKQLFEYFQIVKNEVLQEIQLLKPLVEKQYEEYQMRQASVPPKQVKSLPQPKRQVSPVSEPQLEQWALSELQILPRDASNELLSSVSSSSSRPIFDYSSLQSSLDSSYSTPVPESQSLVNSSKPSNHASLPQSLSPEVSLDNQTGHIIPYSEPKKPQGSFKIRAYTEGGKPLRTVYLPKSLKSKFLRVAELNTKKRLETCGILCGKLRQNAFFITQLVIPAQEATTDTCGTTDETALFDYQDKHDLLTLGWIHTHPTQTCFMSSVDLHTHCSYQLMLPEAIAIVMSPSKTPESGMFRLLDPKGLEKIIHCRTPGLFHMHEGQVYTKISQNGHIREIDASVEMVDLR